MKPAPIDKRLRGEMCRECRELLAAYEEATGRVVMVDYERVGYLFNLAQRDVTPDDMVTMVRYIKRLIRTGANRRKVGTFTPASLEFVNLAGDTARFMDRLQTAREELVSKRVVKGKLVPNSQVMLDGSTITRLVPETERAPAPIRELLASSLLSLVKDLQK